MNNGELAVRGYSVKSRTNEITPRERDYSNIWVKGKSHLLDLSYSDLEGKNLEVKKERLKGVTSGSMREKFLSYLAGEEGIRAVTVCFTDLEGSLQTLDYDKKFLIGAEENLTFDGSSIKGFTPQNESDLRLKVDWTTFRWLPADLFGAGKVLVFGNVSDRDGTSYMSDFRSKLYELSSELLNKGIVANVAPEVEGFLFKGVKAEQVFEERVGFELATMSGYFSSLPHDVLRIFIDKFAVAQRALGFQNEKDHPEVAPAQFELTFRYSTALDTADQIQLYKLLARQVATSMGLTASFLPKPVQSLNGSGMHTNISLSKDGANMFYDANGEHGLSDGARGFIGGVLKHARDLCLIMNSSVNAYRRLDPHYEAPNEIKVSSVDRGSMIRIPIGNENSARIEIRTVAPDANPYLCIYALLKAGLEGLESGDDGGVEVNDTDVSKLPGEIYTAMEFFGKSGFIENIMGRESRDKYLFLKKRVADRCPQELGTKVKSCEVLYHHEVTNQMLWSDF